jgi:hypothetical protein
VQPGSAVDKDDSIERASAAPTAWRPATDMLGLDEIPGGPPIGRVTTHGL